jgi:DNA-binding GntR family transcriptional regulator
MQLTSSSMSAQAAREVRRMIVHGELRDGARINEVRLAAELGVSRTPLREGLGQLVAERVVRSEPRLGFFVAPFTIAEFEQLYDIRPLLDPEALRLAGIPSSASLDRLDRINRRMQAAKTPPIAIDLDDEWHMELLAECPNRVLVELIQQIIGRTRCYEYALFRETKNVWTASNEHELIVAALRRRDLASACSLLQQNMRSGKAPIVAWLTNRSRDRQAARQKPNKPKTLF